jgi:hypothetical protein
MSAHDRSDPRLHASDIEGPQLFVNSTISRDRTEGKKQDDEEALKSVPRHDLNQRSRLLVALNRITNNRRRASSLSLITYSSSGRSSPLADQKVSRHNSPRLSSSPIPWRQGLKIRRSAMPNHCEDGDRGPKDVCSELQSAALEAPSNDGDDVRNDSSNDKMQQKVSRNIRSESMRISTGVVNLLPAILFLRIVLSSLPSVLASAGLRRGIPDSNASQNCTRISYPFQQGCRV